MDEHTQDHDQDQEARQDLDHMEGVDRCVCCGAEIPEGRMVCPACEKKWKPDNRCVMCGAIVYTDGPVCQECMQRLQEARNDL